MTGQRLKYRSRPFLLLGLALMLAGCVPSEAPLSDPDKSPIDDKWMGKWKAKGDEKLQLDIEKVGADGYPPGIVKLALSAKDDDRPPQVGVGFCTTLKGKTYFNLIGDVGPGPLKLPAWKEVPRTDFSIFKYVVDGDTLTIFILHDPSPIETAIKSGKLKGTISDVGISIAFRPRVRLKDTPANVAHLLLSEDEKLFSDRSKIGYVRAK